MIELCITMVIVAVTCIFFRYRHVPRNKITEEIKKKILSNGLIHFTYYNNAIQIQKMVFYQGKRLCTNVKEIWFGRTYMMKNRLKINSK